MPREVSTGRRATTALFAAAVIAAGCGGAAPPPSNPEITPASLSSPGWTVTRRYTAHHALIVEVECRDRHRAVAIARELVEPIKDTYVEALVYVRAAGSTTTRRVQWTKRDGEYRVLDF